MPLPIPIARALAQARKAKGLSQREVAKRAGLTQAQISKVETGAADLTVSSLTELARALDLDVALVPRQLVPAVEGLSRSAESEWSSREVTHKLTSLKFAVAGLMVTKPGIKATAELARVVDALAPTGALESIGPVLEEARAQIMREITQKRMLTSAEDRVNAIVRKLKDLKLAAAIAESSEPVSKPAYTLDDADE